MTNWIRGLCAALSLTSFIMAVGFLLLLFNERLNKPLMVIGLLVALAAVALFRAAAQPPKALTKLPRRQR